VRLHAMRACACVRTSICVFSAHKHDIEANVLIRNQAHGEPPFDSRTPETSRRETNDIKCCRDSTRSNVAWNRSSPWVCCVRVWPVMSCVFCSPASVPARMWCAVLVFHIRISVRALVCRLQTRVCACLVRVLVHKTKTSLRVRKHTHYEASSPSCGPSPSGRETAPKNDAEIGCGQALRPVPISTNAPNRVPTCVRS
jgi:hypothetical protein